MELRSTRSRSKTPFALENVESEYLIGNHVHQTVTRSTHSTFATYEDISMTDKSLRSKTSRGDKTRKTRYKTSDYSSSEGENEVSSSHVITENEKNQIIEDARNAANGSAEISALGLYRKAGRYWEVYPKTDWTYSHHSKDRIELAPGVVQMPNMSRRSLHGSDCSEHLVAPKETNYPPKAPHKPRTLFTNNNFEDREYSVARNYRRTTFWSRVTTFVTSVFTTMFAVVFYSYKYQSSAWVWFGKKVHKAVSKVMLWDTWLLMGESRNKLRRILLLCLLPLFLFGGFHMLLANGVSLVPPCHPHCGRIASDYLNSFVETAQNAFRVTDNFGWCLLSALSRTVIGAFFNATETPNVHTIPVIVPPVITSDLSHEKVSVIASLSDEELERVTLAVKNALKLENTDRISIVNNYNDLRTISVTLGESLRDLKHSQEKSVHDLYAEINRLRVELDGLHKNGHVDDVLAQLRAENAAHYVRVSHQLNRCCRRPFINVEGHVLKIVKDLFRNPEFLNGDEFTAFLRTIFVARNDLEARLANLTQNMRAELHVLVENSGRVIMDDVATKLSSSFTTEIAGDAITDAQIKRIVKDSLAVYDADKTGLVDYAMEPMGGQILSTRCTESYQAGTAVISVLGIPLWYPTNTPRTVITPGINPGECWAFQNFPGFLVVKLAQPITIQAFSYEHISRKLVPGGKIDSAPKEFEVYGLRNETDREPVQLGRFRYDVDGEPLQFFAATVHGVVFDLVEIRVVSNHGNPNYTCLYRFRVHGSVASEPT